MSKIFYDYLIEFTEVEMVINSSSSDPDEKEEMHRLIDEIIHHRVIGCVLSSLPVHHHEEFLERLHQAPYSEDLMRYLQERIEENIEEKIKKELAQYKKELIQELTRTE